MLNNADFLRDDDTQLTEDDKILGESAELDEDDLAIDELDEPEEKPKQKAKSATQQRIDELTARNSRMARERDTERQAREVAERQLSEYRSKTADFEAQGEEHEAVARLREIRAKISKAREEGDFDVENQAVDESMDAQADIVRARARRQPKTPKKETAAEVPSTHDQQQNAPYVSDLAKQWNEKNAEWMGHPQHRDRTARAHSEFSLLVQSGADPDDPETYRKLDANIARFYTPQKKVRRPVGGDEGSTNPKRGGLSKEDVTEMREYGFDPKNSAHVAAWKTGDTEEME